MHDKKTSVGLSSAFQATGINIFTNIGESAGQSIPHLHIHFITRFDNELISPFEILNSPEDRRNLPKLSEKVLLEKVKTFKIALSATIS